MCGENGDSVASKEKQEEHRFSENARNTPGQKARPEDDRSGGRIKITDFGEGRRR